MAASSLNLLPVQGDTVPGTINKSNSSELFVKYTCIKPHFMVTVNTINRLLLYVCVELSKIIRLQHKQSGFFH